MNFLSPNTNDRQTQEINEYYDKNPPNGETITVSIVNPLTQDNMGATSFSEKKKNRLYAIAELAIDAQRYFCDRYKCTMDEVAKSLDEGELVIQIKINGELYENLA